MEGLPAYIQFNREADEEIWSLVKRLAPDKVAILVDENTRKFCLPLLSEYYDQVIEVKSGEQNKNLSTCSQIWDQMTEAGLSRKSLLINLGGGVIGDMGGFVASTYKRGIRFINVPTTLLSQVDASIGGKLGIDYKGLKNHIGVFKDPDAVILSDVFLKTLNERQLRSGYAEVIKHGFIWDKNYLKDIRNRSFSNEEDWDLLLVRSVEIKGEIVEKDPLEKGLRKILNFGHTMGHAVETYHLENGKDMLHGEAVAVGMIMELCLSHQLGWMEAAQVRDLSTWLFGIYGYVQSVPDADSLIKLMIHDKKNDAGQINFSLLRAVGSCQYDVQVNRQQIENAVAYYHGLDVK
ncbi:MAG: 3-dehydroquinate synthase [Cyclobacteriaceae bacterium]